jgi:phosphoribulokinase
MEAKIVKDRNAGNSHYTYYKGWAQREYCIQIGNDYCRDGAGRVRRFSTFGSAEAAALKTGLQLAG